MKINTFKQGKKLVVVFDGLELSETEVLQKFIATLANSTISEDAECEKEKYIEDECPIIPDEPMGAVAEDREEESEETIEPELQTNPSPSFESGPYKGENPKLMLSLDNSAKDIKNAFIYLSKNLTALEGEILQETKEAISEFIHITFKDTDASKYSSALTAGQQKTFLRMYEFCLGEKTKEKYCKTANTSNWAELIECEDVEAKREIIISIIKKFQNN